MLQPNDSLASIHYQSGAVPGETACYTCHSGYGLLGDVAAKRAGLTHMWHELLRQLRVPARDEAGRSTSTPASAAIGTRRSFRAVEAHTDKDLQAALVSREMSCTGTCHPAAHPPEALNGSGTKP